MENKLIIFGKPASADAAFLIGAVLFVALSLCFGAFLYVRSKLRAERQQIEFIEQYQEMQRDYYEGVLYSSRVARLLRHDLRNHLQTAKLLLEENPEQAAAYLEDVRRILSRTGPQDGGCLSLPEHLLNIRRETASRTGRRLDLRFDPAAVDFSSSFFPLLMSGLDIALKCSSPNSQITVAASGQNCFYVRYSGTLPRVYRTQWKVIHEISASGRDSGSPLFGTEKKQKYLYFYPVVSAGKSSGDGA